jgi:hypothetical protein
MVLLTTKSAINTVAGAFRILYQSILIAEQPEDSEVSYRSTHIRTCIPKTRAYFLVEAGHSAIAGRPPIAHFNLKLEALHET